MITKNASPLAQDNIWHAVFVPTDKSLGLPASLSGMAATMTFDPARRYHLSSEWWYGSPRSFKTISTSTGEIVNASNKLTVTVLLSPGEYLVRGDVSLGDVVTPFINGVLRIGNGLAQLSLNPLTVT